MKKPVHKISKPHQLQGLVKKITVQKPAKETANPKFSVQPQPRSKTVVSPYKSRELVKKLVLIKSYLAIIKMVVELADAKLYQHRKNIVCQTINKIKTAVLCFAQCRYGYFSQNSGLKA